MSNQKPNWSEEQVAIFNFVDSGKGNAVIEARAGTGKTTTIKAAFDFAHENKILYAVFNKRNQREAEEKIKDVRVEVKTLHSLGYKYIQSVWKGVRPDDNVEWDRIDSATSQYNFRSDAERQEAGGAIYRVVSFAKNTTINPTLSELQNIMESQDVLCNCVDSETICAFALAAMEKSKVKDAQGRISFNDMVWLPVAMNWVKQWYDLVCIDECQDMNMPQLLMARGACKSNGRIIVVGDPRQAIYGFRGAVQNGMAMMKTQLNAQVFPLTTTYRCPRKVVEMAREIVPDYNAAPEAPDGSIEYLNGNSMLKEAKPGDAILSRLNAPLMIHAMRLLRNGVSARIEGRDIGAQLENMVKNFKAKTVEDLLTRIAKWESTECDRLAKKKNPERKIEACHDQAITLNTLCEGCESISSVTSKIRSLFEDSDKSTRPAVVLSSVHKAKGLEWNRTFMLMETFNQRNQEESNIYYVALTRCKTHLFLVDSSVGEAQPANLTQSTHQSAPESILSAPANVPESQSESVKTQTVKNPDKSASKVYFTRYDNTVTKMNKLPSRKSAETPQVKMLKERWAKNEIEHNGQNVVTMDNITTKQIEKPLPGEVVLEKGNIIMHTGPTSKKGEIARKKPYVVESVNQSGAKVIPLNKTKVEIENKLTGESVGFERAGGPMTISSHIQASEVKHTISEDEMPNRSRANKHTANNEKGNIMSAKKNKTAKTVKGESLKGQYSKRNDFIRKLRAGGAKTDEIIEKVKAEGYPSIGGVKLDAFIKSIDKKATKSGGESKRATKTAAKSKPATKAKVNLPNRKKPAVESADKPAEAIAVSPETVTA